MLWELLGRRCGFSNFLYEVFCLTINGSSVVVAIVVISGQRPCWLCVFYGADAPRSRRCRRNWWCFRRAICGEIMFGMFNIIGITFRYNFTLEYPIVYGTKYITITIPYHFALIDMIRGDINGTFAIINLQVQTNVKMFSYLKIL